MKLPFSLLPLVALLGLLCPSHGAVVAEGAGEQVQEPGVFSYQAPKGWKVVKNAMSRYPLAADAPHDNFAANINVVVEAFPGTLAEYVANNKKALQATPALTDVKIGAERPFTTTAGLTGVVVPVTDRVGALKLAQLFYIFNGAGGNKLVVTCSSLVTDAAKYGPIFEETLKSFSAK